jgi:hypothetical protein
MHSPVVKSGWLVRAAEKSIFNLRNRYGQIKLGGGAGVEFLVLFHDMQRSIHA